MGADCQEDGETAHLGLHRQEKVLLWSLEVPHHLLSGEKIDKSVVPHSFFGCTHLTFPQLPHSQDTAPSVGSRGSPGKSKQDLGGFFLSFKLFSFQSTLFCPPQATCPPQVLRKFSTPGVIGQLL